MSGSSSKERWWELIRAWNKKEWKRGGRLRKVEGGPECGDGTHGSATPESRPAIRGTHRPRLADFDGRISRGSRCNGHRAKEKESWQKSGSKSTPFTRGVLQLFLTSSTRPPNSLMETRETRSLRKMQRMKMPSFCKEQATGGRPILVISEPS